MTDRLNRSFKSDEEKEAEANEIVSLFKDSFHLAAISSRMREKRFSSRSLLNAQRERFNQDRAAAWPSLEVGVQQAQEKAAHAALEAATRKPVEAEHAPYALGSISASTCPRLRIKSRR